MSAMSHEWKFNLVRNIIKSRFGDLVSFQLFIRVRWKRPLIALPVALSVARKFHA